MYRTGRIILSVSAAITAFALGVGANSVSQMATTFLQGAEIGESEVQATASLEHEPEVGPIEMPVAQSEPDGHYDAVDDGYPFFYTGTYYLSEEFRSKAFADIEYLDLETHEYRPDPKREFSGIEDWIPIPPKGMMAGHRNYKLDRIAVGQKSVSFSTATVKGVSYKFTGHFSNANDHYSTVLEGTLTKIENGKWAAEMRAEFYPAGC